MARTVVYGFAPEHAEAVASGRKTRTIRDAGRRRHAEPGDLLRFYVGLRTKSCRLLLEAVCIGSSRVQLGLLDGVLASALVDGQAMRDIHAFAKADGFSSPAAMGAFFQRMHGPGEFCGVMIEWGSA